MNDERSPYVRTWALFLILSVGWGSAQTTKTVDGFVTEIVSPTDFSLGALPVAIDGKTQCQTEDLHSNIQLKEKTRGILVASRYFVMQDRPDQKSTRSASCDSLPLRIGSRVQIMGNARQGESAIFATRLTLYEVAMRQTFESSLPERAWEGGALLEETPQVSQAAQGWAGTTWLDGYPVKITRADTTLLTAPSGTELSYRPFGPLSFFTASRWDAVVPHAPAPALSGSLFQPNTWAAYRGVGVVDGHVLLYQIRLWPNQIDARETQYRTQLTPAIRAPDYQNHISGSVRFPHSRGDTNLTIIPDGNVQGFVSSLGTSLIPQYQKALPETDATKVHFRFYVVQVAGPTFDHDFAIASPSGLILVPEHTLTRMDNKAQLASILSYAITSVLQKHSYITAHARPTNPGDVGSVGPDFTPYVLELSMNEQAFRVGIRQMYLAGYDIRQAPYAWAAADGKPVLNPVMDPKYPSNDIPWDTAYAFDYLSQFYTDVDYGKLMKGEAEYAQFLDELRKTDPEAFANP